MNAGEVLPKLHLSTQLAPYCYFIGFLPQSFIHGCTVAVNLETLQPLKCCLVADSSRCIVKDPSILCQWAVCWWLHGLLVHWEWHVSIPFPTFIWYSQMSWYLDSHDPGAFGQFCGHHTTASGLLFRFSASSFLDAYNTGCKPSFRFLCTSAAD